MKRKLMGILVVLSVFLITGCGKKDLKLDEVIKDGDYSVKMIRSEFISTHSPTITEECFLTNSETYKEGDSEFICRQDKPKESGNTFYSFELEFEYTGKEKQTVVLYSKGAIFADKKGEFRLDYNDGYIVEPESIYVKNANANWSGDNKTYVAGSAINTKEIEIDPLKNTKFVVRGIFEVPEKLETDKDSTLVMTTPFGDYTIR